MDEDRRISVIRYSRKKSVMRITRSALVLSLLLIPALSLGLKLQNDHDDSIDFLNFTTYAWRDGAQVSDEALHGLIVRSIEGELAKKYLGGSR